VNFPYYIDQHFAAPPAERLNSDSLYAEVIRSGQALLLSPLKTVAGRSHARSWLGVPLKSQHHTIGALVVQRDDDSAHYTAEDQELLQFVSNEIAAAIERKQMIAALQRTALYDRLTQLPNRELFHDRIQLALARVRRDHVQLSLLYVDLDKFKAVNDRFGHAAGDLLLQKVARRMEECVRAGDTVARFGGDEFVVLLENVGAAEHTAVVVEKLRLALEAPFDLAGQDVSVVASIGVAHCPLHGEDESQLLRHADDAMYLLKRRLHGPPGLQR
jgi:diguanylate cyclase (GGDEF)-like protein